MSGNGYKMIGYVVWKGGRWYLRQRLPRARRVVLVGVAVTGGALAAAILAKRLSS
ncbi:MAG TPA: hypothetical protein VNR42_09710 [Solirubrobacteraceae bacterium]|jgi:hypothetical protein|nr:hypothetical protein [Solirubrobacteraceae bacterium]